VSKFLISTKKIDDGKFELKISESNKRNDLKESGKSHELYFLEESMKIRTDKYNKVATDPIHITEWPNGYLFIIMAVDECLLDHLNQVSKPSASI